jgi:ribulose-5-phosphate 4-epimerase/fuculose-1-phosphate aldolase
MTMFDGQSSASTENQEIKSKLATLCRLLEHLGLIDFSGHVSARVPGTENVLINPRNVARCKVPPADLLTIDLDGRVLEERSGSPSEFPIHTEIYRVRPDVMSVVHLHSPMAILVATAKLPYVPVVYHGAMFSEGVPLLDYSGHIDTRERGQALARLLENRRAVLIRGHGAVVTAMTVESALLTSVCLEENAKYLYQLSQLGKVTPLSDGEIEEGTRFLRSAAKLWSYYGEKLKLGSDNAHSACIR